MAIDGKYGRVTFEKGTIGEVPTSDSLAPVTDGGEH